MTDVDDRAGLYSPVTLSNEKAPSPSGHLHTRTLPAPAAWRPLTADARLIADPVPAGLAGIPYLDTTTGSVLHADLKRD
jgi:hypothetical protein